MNRSTSSRTEQVLSKIRRSGVFREHVAMEASTGWPIPVGCRWEGRDAAGLLVPVFATRPRPGGGVDLFPPFAGITAIYPSGLVAVFRDHRFETPDGLPTNFDSPVGSFPHAEASGTIGGYQERRRQVLACYDELLDAIGRRSTMTDGWWDDFAAILAPLLEPGLVPSYRAMNDSFFAKLFSHTSPPR